MLNHDKVITEMFAFCLTEFHLKLFIYDLNYIKLFFFLFYYNKNESFLFYTRSNNKHKFKQNLFSFLKKIYNPYIIL